METGGNTQAPGVQPGEAPGKTQDAEQTQDVQQADSQHGGPGGGKEAVLDGNALFKKGHAHAEKVHAEWLQKTFGTADRAEIERLLSSGKNKKPDDLPQSVKDEMSRMAHEIEDLTRQIQERDRNQAITEGILSSGLDFNNRQDVIDLMRLRYDFKNVDGQMVAYSKQTGDPVIVGNKFATVKDVLTAWSKDPQHAYLFRKANKTAMPEIGGNGVSAKLKQGELTNPDFVQALKESGEYYKAIMDQPFDREKVEHFMKLQNGKNLTAVQVG